MQNIIPVETPNNPTDSQRHRILLDSLERDGRPEDLEHIISLLSPPPDITNYAVPGEFKKAKVGIIGGGLAGLSAAFELRKLGFDITIFEASENRIGGRVYTHYFDKSKNLYGELGAMRIPVSHECTWHYVNLFKLNTNPFIQGNPNTFIYVRDTRVRNDPEGRNIMKKIYPLFNLTPEERNTPWPELYDRIGRNILLSMSPKIREQIVKILPEYSPQFLFYSNRTLRRILELAGLSEGAISMITSIIPSSGGFFYYSYGEIMHEDYTEDFTRPYEIKGGTANLPLAFYNSLTTPYPKEYGNIPSEALGKVHWKGGNWVSGIYKSDDNNRVVLKYRNKQIKDDMYETFDYVICAIPFSVLRIIDIKPLFRNAKMEAIREVNYVNAQKTIFLCKERFWEKGTKAQRIIGGASYTDLPIQSIVYPSHHGPELKQSGVDLNPSEPGVFQASYNLSSDAVRIGSTEEPWRFQLIKRQVEEVHGFPYGYLDNIVQDHKTVDWDDEPWAKGAFDIFYPGQKRVFLDDMIKPEYDNRIFFAGEHTSKKHAWMQGALFSGLYAANSLVYCSKVHGHGRYK